MIDMPVGTVFEHEGIELIVAREVLLCNGCHFSEASRCTAQYGTRNCTKAARADKTNVVYMRPNDYAVARLKGEL